MFGEIGVRGGIEDPSEVGELPADGVAGMLIPRVIAVLLTEANSTMFTNG
jgi:hypothetical protein